MSIPKTLDSVVALPNCKAADSAGLPQESGLYFVVLDGEEVVYVGRSMNIRNRWRSHNLKYRARRNHCAIHYLLVDEDIERAEADALMAFEPRWNVNTDHVLRTSAAKNKTYSRNQPAEPVMPPPPNDDPSPVLQPPVIQGAFVAWRTHMGYSQQQAADRLGVSRQTVQSWDLNGCPEHVDYACTAIAMGLPKWTEWRAHALRVWSLHPVKR